MSGRAARPRRESRKALRARAEQIIDRLEQQYPVAATALQHDDPLQLLIATILSAQCTDKLVNQVTPELFRRYSTAADYAAASEGELEELIRPINYYRTKSRRLREVGQVLLQRHGGEVPQTLEELVALPGVGRKTANVVLGAGFGAAVGVVVDTHVRRLSRRLGLTGHEEPERIEQDLMALLPQERWIGTSHRLILHGRAICVARKPRCLSCLLADLCPSATPEAARIRR